MDKGNQSIWKFYLDFLPSDYSNFPIFYGEKEYEYLKGTIFVSLIEEREKDVKKDYDILTKEIPELSKYDFNLFKKIREVVGSRLFDFYVKGKITKAFVPYADLLNHKKYAQTVWNYDDKINSFFIKGKADIKKGEEVFDSYGRKPNHVFLLYYGFIEEINNPENEIIIDIIQNKSYPYFKEKISFKKIIDINLLFCFWRKRNFFFVNKFFSSILID